ncbi:MAG: helix-turn-helix transcriptional regulator [Pseudomonadota bacterium]
MKSPKISMSQIDKKIAARIRTARQDSELDADWVAERLGMPKDVYQALEAGELFVRAIILARLSTILNRKVSWFYADCPGQDVFSKTRA